MQRFVHVLLSLFFFKVKEAHGKYQLVQTVTLKSKVHVGRTTECLRTQCGWYWLMGLSFQEQLATSGEPVSVAVHLLNDLYFAIV